MTPFAHHKFVFPKRIEVRNLNFGKRFVYIHASCLQANTDANDEAFIRAQINVIDKIIAQKYKTNLILEKKSKKTNRGSFVRNGAVTFQLPYEQIYLSSFISIEYSSVPLVLTVSRETFDNSKYFIY